MPRFIETPTAITTRNPKSEKFVSTPGDAEQSTKRQRQEEILREYHPAFSSSCAAADTSMQIPNFWYTVRKPTHVSLLHHIKTNSGHFWCRVNPRVVLGWCRHGRCNPCFCPVRSTTLKRGLHVVTGAACNVRPSGRHGRFAHKSDLQVKFADDS